MTPTHLRTEYERGATVRDLKRRLRTSTDRVLRLLADAGTTMRRRGPQPTLAGEVRRAEARVLRDAGLSYRAIAGRLGCEVSGVWRMVNGDRV